MGRRFIWLAFFVAPVLPAAEPVGLLSMVSGEVQLIRAGESAPSAARTADLIGAGDRVLTGANSEATFLFCPESRAAKMMAQSEVQFDTASLAVKKGKLAEERKVPTCRLPASLVLAAASKLQAGNMRLRPGDRPMLLRSPANTLVTSLTPRFRWDPVENAAGYEIKLQDREERILWKSDVSGTEISYPSTASPLAWGQKYRWRVTAKSGEDAVDEAGSSFQVMPNDQAEKVRAAAAELDQQRTANPGDIGPLFLLAFLYEDNGMLDEAVRLYGELAQRMGPQDWVQNRMNDLMGKLGWDRLESGTPR
ncbi:MAG: hypothetical protein HY316_05785 [Acidobacteria bacterium]|nr:hypothetical protein [Acidobacteriota bacterium]